MPGNKKERILILGGTDEAHRLAAELAAEGHRVITSLAGRTLHPRLPEGEVRFGGFGGAAGLADYLGSAAIDRVIDATHPFARQISANAREACLASGIPLAVVERPGWNRQAEDRWQHVASLEQAAAALPAGARAFLALGRQYLSPFRARSDCHFVVRMVDPPPSPLDFASAELVLGKPSRDPSLEMALFQRHEISHLVCRNSGGEAGYAKIIAARELKLPVIIIDRPAEDATARFGAAAW